MLKNVASQCENVAKTNHLPLNLWSLWTIYINYM